MIEIQSIVTYSSFAVEVRTIYRLPFNRIQAPSDLVNGLGIGAYTFDKNGLKCNANKTWTLSTLSELNPNDVDSYTCDCVEDYFYPHDKHYNYFKNTIHGRKQKAAFVGTDSEKELYDLGYSRSDLPISKPPKQFLSEDELRSQHLKWDTVTKKTITMRASSLSNPFFILHGINRDIIGTTPMKYFVAITVEIPKYPGVLYDDILAQYRNLVPINIKVENQIFVEL